MFRIIYLRGDVFRIMHRKLKFGGDIWGRGGGGGDLLRIIYLKGDVFRIFFLILFRSTDSSFCYSHL